MRQWFLKGWKCGSWTSYKGLLWAGYKCRFSGPNSDRLNRSLHLNMIPTLTSVPPGDPCAHQTLRFIDLEQCRPTCSTSNRVQATYGIFLKTALFRYSWHTIKKVIFNTELDNHHHHPVWNICVTSKRSLVPNCSQASSPPPVSF